MSTEKPDTSVLEEITQDSVPKDSTQQTAKPKPTTQPEKNQKRVAPGKLAAAKTWQAREVQKKALEEANATIAKYRAKETPSQESIAADTAPSQESSAVVGVSITQWFAAGSFIISLLMLYYRREELKAAFSKKSAAPVEPPVDPQQQPVPRPRGIRPVD